MESRHHDFIHLETPRVRKFYEKYAKRENETPLPQINNFLQLLTSPADGQLLVKLQYMNIRHQDLIANHLENSLSAMKTRNFGFNHFENSSKRPETAHKSDVEEFLFDCGQPGKKLIFSQEQNTESSNNQSKKAQQQQHFNKTLSDEECPLRDITSQINNADNRMICDKLEEEESYDNLSKANQKAMEIRKRKRKSNQQLKVLQAEFERDGFWSKDKILHVSRTTGLSESQVISSEKNG